MASIAAPFAEYVGHRIREARKSAGLSHDSLAQAIGTWPNGRQHLIKLEQGRHLPTEDTLAAIAAATGHGVEWFLPVISEPRDSRLRRYRVAQRDAVKVAA